AVDRPLIVAELGELALDGADRLHPGGDGLVVGARRADHAQHQEKGQNQAHVVGVLKRARQYATAGRKTQCRLCLYRARPRAVGFQAKTGAGRNMSDIATRRGGTAGRRAAKAGAPLVQKRYITREIPLYELLGADGIELIHQQSMTILEEIGIDFRDEPALAAWRRAGADVRDQRVRIPRELLLEKLALAPSS